MLSQEAVSALICCASSGELKLHMFIGACHGSGMSIGTRNALIGVFCRPNYRNYKFERRLRVSLPCLARRPFQLARLDISPITTHDVLGLKLAFGLRRTAPVAG